MKKNMYQIVKNCFDFASSNHQFGYQHISLYLYLVNLCNKLQWDLKFGVPTDVTIHSLSMGYKTYKKCLFDLESLGALKIVEFSSNQYTSLVIELNIWFGDASVKCPKHDQSTTKARPKHDQHNNTINTNNTDKIYIYIKECFDFYKTFYFETLRTPYVESSSEKQKLQSLLHQLEEYRLSLNDQRNLKIFFQDFITNAWNLNHYFYSKNFTLSVLDKKFNDLISQLRNNKGKSIGSNASVYIKPSYWQPKDIIN